jgi:hypothetical protein
LEVSGNADNDQPVPQNLGAQRLAILAWDEDKDSHQNQHKELSKRLPSPGSMSGRVSDGRDSDRSGDEEQAEESGSSRYDRLVERLPCGRLIGPVHRRIMSSLDACGLVSTNDLLPTAGVVLPPVFAVSERVPTPMLDLDRRCSVVSFLESDLNLSGVAGG